MLAVCSDNLHGTVQDKNIKQLFAICVGGRCRAAHPDVAVFLVAFLR
jgi:hypothetical protein